MTEETFSLESSPYASVRVRVMQTLLIPAEEYQKLLKMSLPEISNYLGETEYQSEIRDMGVRYSGIELIEMALNSNYDATIQKLHRISPPSYNKMIDLYLARNDAENIKTILRGVIAGLNPDDIRKMLFPSVLLSSVEDLMKKKSKEEILAALPMPFKGIPPGSLFEMENAIDRAYFSFSLKSLKKVPEQGILFRQFLFEIMEAINIMTVLRLLREEVEDKEKYLFYNRTPLLRRLMAARSLSDAQRILSESPYKIESTDTLIPFEISLYRQIYARTLHFQHQDPFSVYVVLGYLFAKEMEIRNVRKIVQSKHLGILPEEVEAQLVI